MLHPKPISTLHDSKLEHHRRADSGYDEDPSSDNDSDVGADTSTEGRSRSKAGRGNNDDKVNEADKQLPIGPRAHELLMRRAHFGVSYYVGQGYHAPRPTVPDTFNHRPTVNSFELLHHTRLEHALEAGDLVNAGLLNDTPRVNLMDVADSLLRETLLQQFFPEERARYENMAASAAFGRMVMCGPAGSGNTTSLAIATLLLLSSPSGGRLPSALGHAPGITSERGTAASSARIVGDRPVEVLDTTSGRIIAAGPTATSMDNFADTLVKVSQNALSQYRSKRYEQRDKHEYNSDVRLPLVLRGYSLISERQALIDYIRNSRWPSFKTTENDEWRPEHSIARWYLKILRIHGEKVGADDPSVLHYIQRNDGWRLRQEIRTQLEDEGHEIFDLPTDSWVTKTVHTHFRLIASCADIVCLTPSMVMRPPWKEYNSRAMAVVFDDAAALSRPDALIVEGTLGRPCLMAGDLQQIEPTVKTRYEEKGRVLNCFEADGGVSILQWAKLSGLPVFEHTTQRRMAEDGFLLGRLYACDSLKPVYAEPYDSQDCPIGESIEKDLARTESSNSRWERRKDLSLAPTLVHCPDTEVKQMGTSRVNDGHLNAAVELIEWLLEKTQATAESIVVLTPYTAQRDLANTRFSQLPNRHNINAIRTFTVDDFRGKEKEVVIFMQVAAGTGSPGLTAQKTCLNVALSRHKQYLFWIADLALKDTRETKEVAEEGVVMATSSVKRSIITLRKMMTTLEKERRVIVRRPKSAIFQISTTQTAETHLSTLRGALEWAMQGQRARD